MDLRFSQHFALHPMITAMKPFNDSTGVLYMAGLGINFGELPSFDDE
ncbi:MAG: hypothetical protein ACREJX_15975 [Polyangiaceae bacterium]